MVRNSPAVLGEAADTRLAALAAEGDRAAFEEIFERHHRGLLSLCRHLLGSPEEAEDALQDTFAAAYRQLVTGDPPRHLRAWLYTTARNRCLDVLRARRELPAGSPEQPTAGLSELAERRSDLRELLIDMRRLPEDQRAALVLSEMEDLPQAEVAEVLGCRRAKVGALVYQARTSLAGWREARDLPCGEVRQELSVARGADLRRRHLRQHLSLCPDCAAFREHVGRQRRAMALILPVIPAFGLKERILEGAWAAGGGGGAAGAGAGALGAAGGAGPATLGGLGVKAGLGGLALGAAALIAIGGFPGDESPRQPRPGESASETVERGESAARAAERRRMQRREKRAAAGEEPQPAKARVEDGPASREPTGPPEEQAATPPPGGAPSGSAPSASAPGSVNSGSSPEPAPTLLEVEVQGEVQVEVPPVVP